MLSGMDISTDCKPLPAYTYENLNSWQKTQHDYLTVWAPQFVLRYRSGNPSNPFKVKPELGEKNIIIQPQLPPAILPAGCTGVSEITWNSPQLDFVGASLGKISSTVGQPQQDIHSIQGSSGRRNGAGIGCRKTSLR